MPWLKAELEKRGFWVALPQMPDADKPIMEIWLSFIADLVGEPDADTVLVGHSLGCQAVIRYLETLGESGKSVGKTVLVGGGFPPGLSLEEAQKRTGIDRVLVPWLTVPVDAAKVKKAAGKCIAILSDNDPYIKFETTKAVLESTLAPEIIVEHGKGHFNEDDRIDELPSLLAAVLA